MIKGVPYDAELEYLESTGTQWIDTGVKLRNTDTLSCGLYINSSNTGGWYGILGAYDGVRYMILRMVSGSNTTLNAYDPNQMLPFARFTWGRLSFSFGGDVYESDINCYIFKYNIATGAPNGSQSLRFSDFSIERDGHKIRDMIPVRVGTTGYMYDRVTRKLFGNAGTGSFVRGPDKSYPVMSLHCYPKPKPTAKDYVQNGLFRQVDAIDNLGYRQHTDTPTAWRDLIQNDNWNINGAIYSNGMFVKSDQTTLPIQVGLTQAQVDAWRISGASIELVVEPTVNIGGAGCMASVGWLGSLSFFKTSIGTFGIGGTRLDYQVPDLRITATSPAVVLSAVTDLSETKIYINGNLVTTTSNYTASNIAYGYASWNATIGLLGNGRSQANNPDWSNPILGLGCKAFRLYSRALSAAEIAANYAIDKERFNLL